MKSRTPLLEIYGTRKRSSVIILAFGAYDKDDKLLIPGSEIKSLVKKNQILLIGKEKYRATKQLDPSHPPFDVIELEKYISRRKT